MVLAEGQWQIGDLVLGPGTAYAFATGGAPNPFSATVRAEQGGARAWNHGGWSGAEWADERVVPMSVQILAPSLAARVAAHQALAATFAPRGADSVDLEARFMLAGTEYLLRGRARSVEPAKSHVEVGRNPIRCAFVALDPIIYSGELHTEVLGLPSTVGGLAVPFSVPLSIGATVTSGRRTLTNVGTAPAGLQLRADGPVIDPRVSLLTPAGTASITAHLELDSSQWLDIDTAARSVLLQGVADRRGKVSSSSVGWPVLPPGSHELAFDALMFNPDAQLTVSWRDAWF